MTTEPMARSIPASVNALMVTMHIPLRGSTPQPKYQKTVTDMLGWELGPDKEDSGFELLILGVHITMEEDFSTWPFQLRYLRSLDQLFLVLPLQLRYLSPRS